MYLLTGLLSFFSIQPALYFASRLIFPNDSPHFASQIFNGMPMSIKLLALCPGIESHFLFLELYSEASLYVFFNFYKSTRLNGGPLKDLPTWNLWI